MKVPKECSNNNKKIVGADVSVCPLPHGTTQTGITLIALVITIVVLLILVSVSIKLVLDGGIIAHANNAVDKYGKAQQNEIDQINNIFGNNEDQNNAPEELIKYVLGEDLTGQPFENICNYDDFSFPNKLNGENVEMFVLMLPYTENNAETFSHTIYIKYKNNVYRILITEDENAEIFTKSVNLIYEPKGDEGQTVDYSIDGTEANKKKWTILYDDGTNYEIISPESMGSLALGSNDEQAIGSNDFEKAVNSYNNAIDRINTYASSFVTNNNKSAVRSVGSNPNDPNSRNTDKYTSEKIESWNCTYIVGPNTRIPVTINGVGQGSDNNYEQDFIRMLYHGVAGTGEKYWLASRYVAYFEQSQQVEFRVIRVNSNGDYDELNFFDANSGGSAYASNDSCAVRPVVKISK